MTHEAKTQEQIEAENAMRESYTQRGIRSGAVKNLAQRLKNLNLVRKETEDGASQASTSTD